MQRTAALAFGLSCLFFVQAAAAASPPGPAPPKPPRAPGAVGLPPSPSPPASSGVREAAIEMQIRRLGVSRQEAERRLDLQAQAGDLSARLIERFGRGLSYVHFDNDVGRYVVAVGPQGDEQQAREALADFGLEGSEVKRDDLDYVERNQLVDDVTQRVKKVIDAGHATVALVAAGVEITVAAAATADEHAQIDEAARIPGVFVKRSPKNDLGVPAATCNGSVGGSYPGRYCNALRGGSRYWTANTGCSLSWWAGGYYGEDPNYFFTAGHCITPGGTTWFSCDAGGGQCPTPAAGNEVGQRYDYADNGLLHVTTYRTREAGYTDWRDGSRQPITYYAGWGNYAGLDGTIICHGGATTGYSCGIVSSGNTSRSVLIPDPCTINCYRTTLTNIIAADWICVQGGDSGGPVFTSDMRGGVGIVSAGTCNVEGVFEPLQRATETYGVWAYGG